MDLYNNLKEKYEKESVKLKQQSNSLVTKRTISCLVAIIAIGYGMSNYHSFLSLTVVLLSSIAFVFYVRRSSQVQKLLKRTLCKVEINKRALSRYEGTWTIFKNNGEEYIDKSHPFSSDLDIFGKNSLFQFINESNTYYGSKILREILIPEENHLPTILLRQEAVKEISQLRDFCENFKAEGMASEETSGDPHKLVDFLEEDESKTLFKLPYIKYIFTVFPIITWFLPVFGFITNNEFFTLLFVIFLGIQGCFFLLYLSRVNYILSRVYALKKSINNFRAMIELVEAQKFDTSLNINMQKNLANTENLEGAAKCIKRLEVISNFINIRYNSILYLPLNVFFLWDFHCVFALEDLKQSGGNNIRTWLKTLGFFEALTSIAILPQMYPHWTYPEFGNKLEIEVTDLAHPLLDSDRVSNNFSFKNICIISGSNMSGKTTFLRTIGINQVLAYLGAPVCASKYKTTILDIYTCMRIEDDLKQNISTFYAELIRIKKIIDHAKNKTPMLFLIDEIFRGTNSIDRVDGAKQVLLQLNQPYIVGGITTHDLEVCSLAEGDSKFSNYHFSEYYEDDKICFDYKIKEGISTKRNAKYLMKIIGINVRI